MVIKNKAIYLTIIKIVFFIIIFTLILYKTDFTLLIENLKTINYYYLFSSILLSTLVIFLASERLRIIFKLNNLEIDKIDNYLINYYSHFIDNFFFGFIGGDSYKVLSTKGNKKGVIKSVLFDRLTGMIILLSFSIPGVLYYLINLSNYRSIINFQIVIGFLIGAGIIFLVMLFFNRSLILSSLRQFKDVLLRKDILFLGFFIQTLIIFNLYLVFLSLNWNIRISEIFLFIPLISLIIIIPISIKGYGVREFLIVLFFGIALKEVLVFTIVNTAITIFHTSIGAVAHIIYNKRANNIQDNIS